eukprot:GHRQ01019573.1.p3 GENE.GHRQ01019573.1~~GHRQ01019573.1.p3  ORF type:complete len:111 (-),score=17.21 GHRQ01019573.1:817-1149(-)
MPAATSCRSLHCLPPLFHALPCLGMPFTYLRQLAELSPVLLQVEETLSTLSYATRAKNIHNRPTVQYDPREAQISSLRREIELLRQENGLLREQLRAGGAAAGAHARGYC